MKLRLDPLYVSLIAALGLEFGCAVKPSTEAGETGEEGMSQSGDGDGDSSTGNSSTGDGDGDTPAPFECIGETPVLQAGTDQPSGFVMCQNGFIHRSEEIDAIDPLGSDEPSCAEDTFGTCQTGADCVAEDHGRCVRDDEAGCFCEYGCVNDADCAPSQVCAPAGVAGPNSVCIPGACKIDDECGDGLCGLSRYRHCCGDMYQTTCAAPDEMCHVDGDCPEIDCGIGALGPWHCAVEEWGAPQDGVWECLGYGECGCVCGRPFFIDGQTRVATAIERRDWCRVIGRDLAVVDASTRARLAAHWAEIAGYEHASIASFARAGLQLLQLGAPPSLLRDTSRALRDEIEHARIAYALASAYAGKPIGAGPLDIGGALERLDLHAIIDGLITEACVGETLAAIEVAEAGCWAEDPVVATALERIAADEWGHARLGWRTLGWLLSRGDAGLRAFAVARLEAAMTAAEVGSPAASDHELRCHGVLDSALRDEVRRAGLASVVRPMVAALRRTIEPRSAPGLADGPVPNEVLEGGPPTTIPG